MACMFSRAVHAHKHVQNAQSIFNLFGRQKFPFGEGLVKIRGHLAKTRSDEKTQFEFVLHIFGVGTRAYQTLQRGRNEGHKAPGHCCFLNFNILLGPTPVTRHDNPFIYANI